MSPMPARAMRQHGSGSGPLNTARLTGPSINSGISQQFGCSPLYLNVIKNNFTDWSAGTRDANEQLATLPAGATANRALWANYGEDIAHCIKQGSYTLRWGGTTGTDVSVNVTGPGVSNVIRVNPSTVTFDFNNTDTEATVRAAFTNNRGDSTFPITGISCVFTSYVGSFDAGEIFSPDYLACMPTNLLAWRMMSAVQIWGNPTTLLSQVRPESADSWSWFQDGDPAAHFTTGMPYEVAAKLAIKLNCDLMCCFPLAADQACYDGIAARLFTVLASHPNQHVIATVGNENWNTSMSNNAAGQHYLQDIFGAAQSPPINGPQAEAKKNLMAWKALQNAGFPRAQIVRAPEVQLYGDAHSFGYIGIMMDYVDNDGIISAGAVFSTLVDRLNTAPYCHFHDGTFQGQMYHTRLMNLDWVNMSDATMLAYFQNDINEINSVILSLRSVLLAETGRTIPIGCYEWGQEVTLEFGNRDGLFYQFQVDAANNKVVWQSNFLPVTFTDGDSWRHDNTYIAPAGNGSNYTGPNPGTCSASIGNQASAYIRRVDANSARFYSSQAAATATYANDAAAKAASITLYAIYGTQVYTANNATRNAQMRVRMDSFLNGAGGKTLYENMHAGTIGPTLLSSPCQLYEVGGWPIAQYGQWWGLKHGPLSTNNERFLFYKNLPAT